MTMICKQKPNVGRIRRSFAELADCFMVISLLDTGEIVIRPVQAHDVPAEDKLDDFPSTVTDEVLTDAQILVGWVAFKRLWDLKRFTYLTKSS